MPSPQRTAASPARVVIAGGGVGGIECLLALRALAGERVSIDLVSPEREFVYRPLSVLEPFEDDPTPRFDLPRIARDRGARHHLDTVESVDVEAHRVRLGRGDELQYDVLVQATGARQIAAIEGALTFTGRGGRGDFMAILRRAEQEPGRRIVFAVPAGDVWVLPLYELALNTAARLAAGEAKEPRLTLVTPEQKPLGLFGLEASNVVAELLGERGIRVLTGAYGTRFEEGTLQIVPEDTLPADDVVALPTLEGMSLPGLPGDERGFLPIDEHCAVLGATDVYAVGDSTTFPLKQGGMAAEMADTAAEAIAAGTGAGVEAKPFRPVLRAMLLTGNGPRYLSAGIARGPAIRSEADTEPLWWPASKIPGYYMSAYLGQPGRARTPDDAGRRAVPSFEVDLSDPGSSGG
jgi:sulfide:quinone oxidoreductase